MMKKPLQLDVRVRNSDQTKFWTARKRSTCFEFSAQRRNFFYEKNTEQKIVNHIKRITGKWRCDNKMSRQSGDNHFVVSPAKPKFREH